jgi:glyoxylase-like metal-dependent hydrolase (beta-lactamase superfamily II)
MPALCALIHHPKEGLILYDTGYSTRFYDATDKWPYRIMRYLTPAKITADNDIDVQLEKAGLAPSHIKRIILGHGHVDHVPGVIRFPHASLMVEKREWHAMDKPALSAFRHGYLTSLYRGIHNPIDLIDLQANGQPFGPFRKTLDLFGDGTLRLVHLPGHTIGQMGLYLTLETGKKIFFIGDACWLSESFETNTPPSFVIRAFVDSYRDFTDTLTRIHYFHKTEPDVLIIPTHCPKAFDALKSMGLT